MSDSEIHNQRLDNMRFREKLRNAINLNQEVLDDQDNNIVKPIIDEAAYKYGIKVNKAMKDQWNILEKELKRINSTRYVLPPKEKDDVKKYSSVETQIHTSTTPPVSSVSSKTVIANTKYEEEIEQLKATIKLLTAKLDEKDIERKDIIDDFHAKEVRMMKNRQEEIKKNARRYESKILNLQRDNELRIEQLTNERDHLAEEFTSFKVEKQQQIDKFKRIVETLSNENEHLKFENKRLFSRSEQSNADQMQFNQNLMIENKELKRIIENMKSPNDIIYDEVQDDSEDEEIERVPRNEFKDFVAQPVRLEPSSSIADPWSPSMANGVTPKPPLVADDGMDSTEKLINMTWSSVDRHKIEIDQMAREIYL